jgi:hypothetical protein
VAEFLGAFANVCTNRFPPRTWWRLRNSGREYMLADWTKKREEKVIARSPREECCPRTERRPSASDLSCAAPHLRPRPLLSGASSQSPPCSFFSGAFDFVSRSYETMLNIYWMQAELIALFPRYHVGYTIFYHNLKVLSFSFTQSCCGNANPQP